jgi:hypothetical protein
MYVFRRKLSWRIHQEFARKDLEKPRRTSIRIADVTSGFQNISQELYQSTDLLRYFYTSQIFLHRIIQVVSHLGIIFQVSVFTTFICVCWGRGGE